jgi:hypothetical protein
MKHAVLLGLLVLAAATGASAMTREQYAAQRVQVQHKYATDKDRCATLHRDRGQRRACELQAKADYDLARHELRAQYRPSERNLARAQRARTGADFAAKAARCDDLRAGAKRLCLEEAHAGLQPRKDLP